VNLRSRSDAPPAEILRWVERTVGRGWRVVDTRRLTGGIATATHELVLEHASGRRQRVVLRRGHAAWHDEIEDWAAKEAAALNHVRAMAPHLPAPEVLGHRRSALLMRKLPGRIDLAPKDPKSWVQQQADALAAIHAIPPRPDQPREGATRPYQQLEPPPWPTKHRHLWERAIEVIAAGHPQRPSRQLRTFVHGDFQHFNLLWSRGRLTGIVDWGPGPMTHPDRDTGHCRLNLVILYGTEVADDFAERYERAAGRTIDPWFDLFETVVFLPSWGDTILRQVRNRIPVDVDAIHRRVDAHLPGLLERALA
jgi:aminoglycoside phosphotransferase (APT) family kinase protein